MATDLMREAAQAVNAEFTRLRHDGSSLVKFVPVGDIASWVDFIGGIIKSIFAKCAEKKVERLKSKAETAYKRPKSIAGRKLLAVIDGELPQEFDSCREDMQQAICCAAMKTTTVKLKALMDECRD